MGRVVHVARGIKWDTTKEDAQLILKIVARAEKVMDRKESGAILRDLDMDITACHLNGTPLRLADLLAADDFNFTHDVFGIRRFMDRTTGKLTGFFSPRFRK